VEEEAASRRNAGGSFQHGVTPLLDGTPVSLRPVPDHLHAFREALVQKISQMEGPRLSSHTDSPRTELVRAGEHTIPTSVEEDHPLKGLGRKTRPATGEVGAGRRAQAGHGIEGPA
jgi:hypothetical protein